QLPQALARFLTERGHESVHVLDLHMDEAKDVQIWNHITKNQMGLVSKDEDFLHLASRPGETGKLLWVRIGNCRKQVLLRSFERLLGIVLVLEIGIFSKTGSNFATMGNMFEALRLSTEIGLLALVMTPIILTGGIDLSIGSLLGLCGILFGKLWRDGHLPPTV